MASTIKYNDGYFNDKVVLFSSLPSQELNLISSLAISVKSNR